MITVTICLFEITLPEQALKLRLQNREQISILSYVVPYDVLLIA